jgi:hypothetical protein
MVSIRIKSPGDGARWYGGLGGSNSVRQNPSPLSWLCRYIHNLARSILFSRRERIETVQNDDTRRIPASMECYIVLGKKSNYQIDAESYAKAGWRMGDDIVIFLDRINCLPESAIDRT